MSEQLPRRLAAVLSADIVGYSRLVGDDESGTLTALRQLRKELFGPSVAGHRGQIIKSMGDGWLVEFGSAVEAVTCAMQVQDGLADHNTIKLRIGVHIGDIIHDNEDIFGDGVNVASRLQEIASPGAVTVSGAVFGALDGTLRPSFDDQGEQVLKNIALPIHVWSRGGEIAGQSERRSTRSDFPQLSIVPVKTSDDRAAIQELADALTNDLISFFGATYWLTTEVTLKPNRDTYIARSTLRAMGDRLRLETSLTAPDGSRIWSAKHDGETSDYFDWQDNTGQDLATHFFGRILDRESIAIDKTPEADVSAEQWFLRSVLLLQSQDAGSMRQCVDCLSRSIKLAPDWGYAYSCALGALFASVSLGYSRHVTPYLAKQNEWAKKADTLEPAVSPARAILAFARLGQTGDIETVRADMIALLRNLPFDPDVLVMAGYLFLYVGDSGTALDCFNRLRLFAMHTPYASPILNGIASCHLQLGEYAEAIKEADAALHISPGYPASYRVRAAACAQLGRTSEAAEALTKLNELVPEESISGLRKRTGYQDTPGTRRYFDGLRKAGLPD